MFNNSSRSIYKFNAFPYLFHLLSHLTARHLLFGRLLCVYTKWRELQDWQPRCFCVENKASRVIIHWVSREWFSCLTASPVSHLPQSPLQENTLLCTQQLRRKARRVLSSPSQPLQSITKLVFLFPKYSSIPATSLHLPTPWATAISCPGQLDSWSPRIHFHRFQPTNYSNEPQKMYT